MAQGGIEVGAHIQGLKAVGEVEAKREVGNGRADLGFVRVVAEVDNAIAVHVHESQVTWASTGLHHRAVVNFGLRLENTIRYKAVEITDREARLKARGHIAAYAKPGAGDKVHAVWYTEDFVL